MPHRRIDGTALIDADPWLEPYAEALRHRHEHYRAMLERIAPGGDLTGEISLGHRYFGFNRGERDGRAGVWYREWAPEARQLALIGAFNDWDRTAHVLTRDPFGTWHLFLPDDDAHGKRLTHESLVKVHVVGADGSMRDRIPAYITRVVQDDQSKAFTGQYWCPPEPYVFQHERPTLHAGLRIYEAHIGMALEEPRVGTFDEFRAQVLPRIAELGYNAIQLMAIAEHPYYGSFGYHVSNFFAVSSRFGTPEQLRHLIDEAHRLGLVVLMDLIHSHSVKNIDEGLNRFDGSTYQYFHAGPRGEHPGWDSLLFDYSKHEVLRFLLSNVRYWQEEIGFDGFRFDGITSMMYLDHGMGDGFHSYDDYFSTNVDRDAVAYLQIANHLAHAVEPGAITIAEDVSGMVGLAAPIDSGGLGFDYRLAMGVPDYWIKILKEKRDEDWSMNELYQTLMNRRFGEKHVGYCESHDQALVGDKTLAFWLMDQEMYWHMNRDSESLVIDRGIALHKLIRLVTFALAGEGYLTFIGNEFGHPEWVDFPREGNGFSFQHARRQWSLVDNPGLRYRDLAAFDKAMLALDADFHVLTDPLIEQLAVHEQDNLLVYRRGPVVFVLNFHPDRSLPAQRIPVPDATDYRLVLDTDAAGFGGQGRIAEAMTYPLQRVAMYGRAQSVELYVPARTAQVLAPVGLVV
ncbi:MAG: alpha amylase C-terminal domain-containing protein [Phycisphaeraceae bacterium]